MKTRQAGSLKSKPDGATNIDRIVCKCSIAMNHIARQFGGNFIRHTLRTVANDRYRDKSIDGNLFKAISDTRFS